MACVNACTGVLVIATRGGGSDGYGWSASSIFGERSLKREFSPFFSQMTAIVCGGEGVRSPLVEPKMGREGKWPT